MHDHYYAFSANNADTNASEVFNPFGVIVSSSAAVDTGADLSDPAKQNSLSRQSAISLALDYGVQYFRIQIYYDKWMNSTSRTSFLSYYKKASNAGLKILLNVNWYDTDSAAQPFPDADAYGSFLTSVLDTLNAIQMKPELIVIENEEQNCNRHIIDMSSVAAMHADQQKYIDELAAGVDVCSNYIWWDGAVGIKVTNGGFTTRGTSYNTWNWLKNETRDTASARAFARNAFPPKVYEDLYRKKMPVYLSRAINMGNYYVEAFQQIPLSFINLHWYEPARVRGWNITKEKISPWDTGISQDSISPGVLDEVVEYMSAKFVQKLVAQEVGQLTTSSALNKAMTDKFLSRPHGAFDYVCWYDGDSDSPYDAKAMHNTCISGNVSNYTKRENGYAFEYTNSLLRH